MPSRNWLEHCTLGRSGIHCRSAGKSKWKLRLTRLLFVVGASLFQRRCVELRCVVVRCSRQVSRDTESQMNILDGTSESWSLRGCVEGGPMIPLRIPPILANHTPACREDIGVLLGARACTARVRPN